MEAAAMIRFAFTVLAAIAAGFGGSMLVKGEQQIAGQPVQNLDDLARAVDLSDPFYPTLKRALDAPVTLDLQNVPLRKALESFAATLDIEVQLDGPGLGNAKVDDKTPVSLRVRNLRARDAFVRLLRPLKLCCIPYDGVLRITDEESAKKLRSIRIYPVADLCWHPAPTEYVSAAMMLNQITNWVDRELWEVNGGDTTIQIYPPSLSFIVNGTESTHVKLEAMLSGLRSTRLRVASLRQAAGLAPVNKHLDQALASIGETTKKDAAPDAPDKVAFEAKRLAEAALRTALRVELEMLDRRDAPHGK
jgi:hypothetical protein